MTRKERYEGIVSWFEENMPVAETELHFGSPFQLLVAVILSAQCTDRRVNMTTPALFEAYPTPEKMAAAGFDDLFPYVRSISYPNSKTRHLLDMAAQLMERFGGEVPSGIDELMSLPGVGRKTADGKTPEAVEKDLESHIPENRRARAHHWLILQGRYVCTARKPSCAECGLKSWCREYQNNDKINGKQKNLDCG